MVINRKTFPRTLAAAQRRDGSQWDIGDALIAELGEPVDGGSIGISDGSRAEIEQVAKYLLENGQEYAIRSLAEMRTMAYRFPPRLRSKTIAFGVHRVAGSPEMLESMLKAAKGKPISQVWAENFKYQLRREQDIEQEKAQRRARAFAEKAAEKEREAKAKLKNAEDERSRKAAENALEEARKQREEAEAALKQVPPKKREIPKEDEANSLVIGLKVTAFAEDALLQVQKCLKELKANRHEMSEKTLDAVTEVLLEVSNTAREGADVAGGAKKRDRLSVVR